MKFKNLKTYWEFIKEENTPVFSIHDKKIGDTVVVDGKKIIIDKFLTWDKNHQANCNGFEGDLYGEKIIIKYDGSKYVFESNNDIKIGKYVFNSFLKIITALGLKDIKPNWDHTPDDFLLFFEYESDYQNISNKFNRFASLQPFVNEIPQTNTKLYYGIKLDNNFSFGFYDDKIIEIGNFNLNKNNLNYLLLIPSVSATHLKRELAYITNQNLKYISLITKYIKNFHIGNTEERKFEIKDGILEFRYKGLNDNLMDVKNKFIQYLLKSKLSDKILISISRVGDWTKLSIKLK